jgi:hypothetical protein
MDIGAITEAVLAVLNGGSDSKICFECGGKGHYARDCYNRTGKKGGGGNNKKKGNNHKKDSQGGGSASVGN